MSEHTHHHHHHHHHHKNTDIAAQAHRELLSIARRKNIGKWIFRALCVVAVLMAIAVVVVYKLT